MAFAKRLLAPRAGACIQFETETEAKEAEYDAAYWDTENPSRRICDKSSHTVSLPHHEKQVVRCEIPNYRTNDTAQYGEHGFPHIALPKSDGFSMSCRT